MNLPDIEGRGPGGRPVETNEVKTGVVAFFDGAPVPG